MKMRPTTSLVVAMCLLGAFSAPVEAAKEKFVRDKPHLSIAASAVGVDLTGFHHMSGFGVDIEVIEEGDGSGGTVRKRPGRLTWDDVALKRGYTGVADVQNWALEALRADVERRDITIVILDRDGDAVRTFILVNCFPTSWKLMTNEDGLLIEEVTLTFDRIRE